MAKAPAFQFYPADWQRDLSEHPLEIEGAWIRICCALWWSDTPGKAEKPLTNWARVLRVGERKCFSIINYLLMQKIAEVVIKNDLITISSRRMERDNYITNIRRNVGKLGGNPAFETGKSNPYYTPKQDKQTDKQNITPSSSTSTSTSKNNNPPTPRKRGMVYADDFLTFWKSYPKKVGKNAAWRRWKQLNGTRPELSVLVSAIQKQAQSEQWLKEGGQYIPHPATWLHEGRWEDEITTPQEQPRRQYVTI